MKNNLDRSKYKRFILALKNNDKNRISMIIKKYPNFHNYIGNYGDLIQTIIFHNKKFLEYAFKCGLSPDAGMKRPLQTLLQQAASDGDLKTVRLAINYGADINKKNIEGETALGYACSWGQFKVVKILVKTGVDVNEIEKSRDSFCSTALDACLRYPRIKKYLLKNGAKTYKELKAKKIARK